MKHVGKLHITTPSDREIAMSREFHAPRDLVWEAYTRPEHLTRWLGVHNGWTFPICEMDLRVGGAYRWVWRSPDGQEMGMGGIYREIVLNTLVVATERFDNPWYEGEAVDTVTFDERGGIPGADRAPSDAGERLNATTMPPREPSAQTAV